MALMQAEHSAVATSSAVDTWPIERMISPLTVSTSTAS
jgi:hypothetical protein